MLRMIPVLLALAALLGCAGLGNQPDDQIPAYGGGDRDTPELKKADEEFFAKEIEKHGSREAASRSYADEGFELYRRDDLQNAMRRFNQAWLLDPKNPAAYHGFGAVLSDRD